MSELHGLESLSEQITCNLFWDSGSVHWAKVKVPWEKGDSYAWIFQVKKPMYAIPKEHIEDAPGDRHEL